MYTAIPDPNWPTGYEQAVRQRVEAQWTAIREAESAVNAAAGGRRSEATALPPAHPTWPGPVRAAWESYRQARTAADELIEVGNRLAEAGPDERQADTASWNASCADHDAETAYEQFTAAWDDWQFGHGMPIGPDELEAGS
jgi:hypothetical protein